MPTITHLLKRGTSHTSLPLQTKLLAVVSTLLGLISLLLLCYMVIRIVKRRRDRKLMEYLDSDDDSILAEKKGTKRLTIETRSHIVRERLVATPPTSPLPEIRITFPDEIDKSGQKRTGSVVVLKMGENNSYGLEPLGEQLPPYERGRFESLDLERMGGLKEKEYS